MKVKECAEILGKLDSYHISEQALRRYTNAGK